MSSLPTIKQLEYLAALAETGHFAKAAERCAVTPSTLSAGIRELEQILGAPVAERSKRVVLMTPFGLEAAAHARSLLEQAGTLATLAATRQAPMSGDWKLGVIPTISPFLLPRAIPALHSRFPKLRLFLDESQTDDLLSRVRNGELDLALIALPFEIADLASLVLFEDPFVFACARGHRLAKARSVSIAEMAAEPLLLLGEGHCLHAHALAACALPRSPQRDQYRASSLQTLVQMVAIGIGVTLLPKLAVDAGLAADAGLALVRLKQPASRQIALCWRRSSPRAEEFQLLGAIVASVARKR